MSDASYFLFYPIHEYDDDSHAGQSFLPPSSFFVQRALNRVMTRPAATADEKLFTVTSFFNTVRHELFDWISAGGPFDHGSLIIFTPSREFENKDLNEAC